MRVRIGAASRLEPHDDAAFAARRLRCAAFILRMALREIRASWQRLLFFFVCIAVGVAAIVALRSVIQSVRDGTVTTRRGR